MKQRLAVGGALVGLGAVGVLLALYAPLPWYFTIALWVGAFACAVQAFRSALGRSRPPLQQAADSSSADREVPDAVAEAATGVLRIMKGTVIAAALAVLVPLTLLLVVMGAAFLIRGQWQGLLPLGGAGLLVWYALGPLMGLWEPQGVVSQWGSGGDGGDGDGGGGE